MIVRKTAIAALASIAMFVASCGNSNSHNQHEGHDHATETAVSKTETQNANLNLGYNQERIFILKYCLLEKAVYELGYELNSRPQWAVIPLKGISNIINH